MDHLWSEEQRAKTHEGGRAHTHTPKYINAVPLHPETQKVPPQLTKAPGTGSHNTSPQLLKHPRAAGLGLQRS